MEEVLIDNLVVKFLNPSGSLVDHRTVKFGSGAGPKV